MALSVHFTHPLRSFDASVQLTVPDGATTALVGPSGAGKTTVLRVVAGLLRPRTGVVTLGDRTWLDTRQAIDVPPERRKVGYLFQEYALFPTSTCSRTCASAPDATRPWPSCSSGSGSLI